MISKKDLTIAALATFCLTATLFIILPIRGQEGEYDPWLDVNDDGKTDIRDIILAAKAFGTSGDPAKPVNVTNWPSAINVTNSNFAWSGSQNITFPKAWSPSPFNTTGFSQVTVKIQTNSTVEVWLYQVVTTPQGDSYTTRVDYSSTVSWYSLTETYSVAGNSYVIQVENSIPTSTAKVQCCVYMNSIPSIQTGPTYDNLFHYQNFSSAGFETPFHPGGYGRMAVSLWTHEGTYITPGLTWTATICLSGISWGPPQLSLASYESLSKNALNVTISVEGGYADCSTPLPFITETKGSQCILFWKVISTVNAPPDWWITLTVNAYFRNE